MTMLCNMLEMLHNARENKLYFNICRVRKLILLGKSSKFSSIHDKVIFINQKILTTRT